MVLNRSLHRFELELRTRTGIANLNWKCELFSLLSMLLLRSLISALRTGTANWNCEIKLELRIILIIVIDTSCCERGYSLMNRTHTAERNLLKVETVNDLMAIVNLGPDVDDLDVQDMVRRWLEASQKGRKLSSKFNKGFGLDFSDS